MAKIRMTQEQVTYFAGEMADSLLRKVKKHYPNAVIGHVCQYRNDNPRPCIAGASLRIRISDVYSYDVLIELQDRGNGNRDLYMKRTPTKETHDMDCWFNGYPSKKVCEKRLLDDLDIVFDMINEREAINKSVLDGRLKQFGGSTV